MLALKITNRQFTPLAPSDSAAKALAKMDAWHAVCLPVVEETTRKIIGQIRLQQLVDLPDESITISTLELEPAVTVFEHHHIFEVTRQMLAHEIGLIPIVDSDFVYQGVAEKKEVLEAFSEMLNVSVSGSVIAVELQSKDYTLSEMVHLIESEDARILGVAVETPTGLNESFEISFKLNVRDTSGISNSLRRHGYVVSSESQSELLKFDISDRADELMRYLDV